MSKYLNSVKKASCLIRVREYNIGFPSRFSHIPEDMSTETVDKIIEYVEDAMANPESLEEVRKIVISQDGYLILGIDGFIQQYVPDPENRFKGFTDVSGNRRCHGFVGFVWNKTGSCIEELPNGFPTLNSFAEIIRTQLLTPLPWPRSMERWNMLNKQQQEAAELEWESKSPEERYRSSTPWYLSDADEWADAIHSGTGHIVPYQYDVELESTVDVGTSILNQRYPDRVKEFPRSLNQGLLGQAVNIARENISSFSFCTDLYFNESKSTCFMNMTNGSNLDSGEVNYSESGKIRLGRMYTSQGRTDSQGENHFNISKCNKSDRIDMYHEVDNELKSFNLDVEVICRRERWNYGKDIDSYFKKYLQKGISLLNGQKQILGNERNVSVKENNSIFSNYFQPMISRQYTICISVLGRVELEKVLNYTELKMQEKFRSSKDDLIIKYELYSENFEQNATKKPAVPTNPISLAGQIDYSALVRTVENENFKDDREMQSNNNSKKGRVNKDIFS